MKSIRGGMGLGDALYVQAVARHIIRTRGERLKVCTAWPDVFRPLGDSVQIAPFTRVGIDYLAHYSVRKGMPTKQFEDMCIQAGIREPVELKLDWPAPQNSRLVRELKSQPLPVVLVQLPRAPMGRKDGFGRELLPNCSVIQTVIEALRGRALLVQVGAGEALYRFRGIDLDLANRTTISELLDVAAASDRVLGYCSFAVPLAECLDKRAVRLVCERPEVGPAVYPQDHTTEDPVQAVVTVD